MNRTTKISALFLALSLLGGGCAAPTTEPAGAAPGRIDGKADADRPLAFASVQMIDYAFAEGEEESFGLLIEASDAYDDLVADGDELTASISATDGASNPDFYVTGSLTYHEDGIGAFVSESPVDTSLLLPWHELTVRLTSELSTGDEIDESWTFVAGTTEAEPSANQPGAPTGLFRGLSLVDYRSTPETASFAILAELGDEHYGEAADGQLLSYELWADDVESYALEGLLTYEADGVGAFLGETIDASDLVPFYALNVRLTGELESGVLIAEHWVFVAGETEARFVGKVVTSPGPVARMYVEDVASEDGDQEFISFGADLDSEAAYFAAEGDTLEIEVWAADGASNADYRVTGTLRYGAGGTFTTEGFIDTSSLLPWHALRVRAFGELRGGIAIDQTFEFDGSSFEGAPVTE